VQRLKRACATDFGIAGRKFVRYLCRQGTVEELCRRVQQELMEAHKVLVPRAAAEEVARVVRLFALVLVAGQLACDADVLPFEHADLEEAVRLVLGRWLDAHGRGPMERAVEQLRAFLLRNEARFRDRDETHQVVRDLVGYRDRERRLFLKTPEGAREALDGYTVRNVMRRLQGRGWLEVNESDRLLSGHRVRGMDRVVRL
jgi:hypothetical protein